MLAGSSIVTRPRRFHGAEDFGVDARSCVIARLMVDGSVRMRELEIASTCAARKRASESVTGARVRAGAKPMLHRPPAGAVDAGRCPPALAGPQAPSR